MLQVTSQNLILKLNLYMETKKKRNFLLRVDWTNWYSSRADIVQGSKSSLNFFQRFKWPMWIGEVSKKDLFHIYIKLLEWSWWNEFENLDTAGKKRSCVGVFFLFVLGLLSGGVVFISILFVHFSLWKPSIYALYTNFKCQCNLN